MALLVFAAVPPSPSASQNPVPPVSCRPDSLPAHTGAWTGPLARRVTLDAGRLPLRDALRRFADAANVRLSFSNETIPLDRPVCAVFDSVPAGDALLQLLGDAPVEPRVVADDLIVLAPSRSRRGSAEQVAEAVFPLDPVIIRVDPTQIAESPLVIGADVLAGDRLGTDANATVGAAINGAVPGMWVWQPAASGLAVQYGSIRGVSSLGPGSPKVYIDGIEIANPLLLTRLSPDAIERVEIIRGPQGAAVFGADAIGGVTNIVTRHGDTSGAIRFRLRSGLRLSGSRYASDPIVGHEHTLSMDGGSEGRSFGLDLMGGSSGEYVPGAWGRRFGADGTFRLLGDHATLDGTLRVMTERAGNPASPLLAGLGNGIGTNGGNIGVDQYTAGVRTTFTTGPRWVHSIVLGADGYRVSGVEDNPLTFGDTPTDSVLRAAGTAAIRGTLRLSSVYRLIDGPAASATLTFAAEQGIFHQHGGLGGLQVTTAQSGNGSPTDSLNDSTVDNEDGERTRVSLYTTGVSALFSAAFRDRLNVVGGLRLERGVPGDGASRFALLPMVGGEFASRAGIARITFRAAWGRGIRWPQLLLHEDAIELLNSNGNVELAPESQSGTEAGIDVEVGRTLGFRVTRFDQIASGLIQRLAVIDPTTGDTEGFQYDNVGSVTNRGWELQASLSRDRLSITGTLSLTDSYVRRLSAGYNGDLRDGDRVLAVPARTGSLSAGWHDDRWSATITAYRASDWVNYDRLALAVASADPASPPPAGPTLRAFWKDYPGVTHLNASYTRQLRPGLSLTLIGDNLLGHQTGEPDNVTVLPGRTFAVGFRVAF